jgi:uncharacterized protein with FMN-binding domain
MVASEVPLPKRHAKHRKIKPFAPSTISQNRAIGAPPASHAARMRIRLSSGLLGLSSAAILTVYAMGYIQTRQLTGPNVISLASEPGEVPKPVAQASASPTPAGQTQAGYKDGTYIGLGTSRHGNIEATVVIQGGKIVSAKVSRCMTRYPCSDVTPLVGEALSIQATPVHHVSGASDSSRAYKMAVSNALSQAA